MTTDSLPADTVNICKCNNVRYYCSIDDGVLRLQALAGFSDVEQVVEIPLRNVLAVELDTKKATPLSRWSLDCLTRSAPGKTYDTAAVHTVVLHLARQTGYQKWRTKRAVLEPEVSEWGEQLLRTIQDYLKQLIERPKRLMFFVNPISGNGQAVKVMEKYLSPLLQMSGVSFKYEVTTREGFAKEWIMKHGALEDQFDGIISVGGDGIFNEIMEGLLRRTHFDDITSSTSVRMPQIRLGLIPSGSTDSIGFCIGLNDPVTALIHILLGNQMMLDVGSVFRASDGQLLKFFCAFLGYGFFSDTLRNSERPWLRRHLGKTRYMLAGAKTFLVNRAYDGSVSFKPAEGLPDGYPDEGMECYKDCKYCIDIGASKSDLFTVPGADSNEKDWQTLDGKFTNVICASMSCRSEMSPRGVVPVSHCGDGCLDLLIIRSINRFRLLNYLVNTQRGLGPQHTLGQNLHAVRAYELMFHTKNNSSTSGATVWNCDGEIITEPNIHVKIYCQLIQMYGVGLERKPTNS